MAKNRVSLWTLLDVRSPWYPQSAYARAIMVLVLLVFTTGLYATAAIFIQGPALLEATDYIPWGIQISTYIFLALTASGLCVVSSLGHVFGIKGYEVISKRAVFLAIVTLIAGFVALAPDLGRPERMILYLLTPSFSSPIWWMGFFYAVYFIFMVAEFLSIHKGRMDWARVMGIGALVFAISAPSTLGGVFGVVMARPLYFGAFMPLYFLLTAFLSGIAIISLASIIAPWAMKKELDSESRNITTQLRRLLALVLGITLIFTAWNMLVGLYAPADVYRATYSHVLSSWLWRTEITLGLAIPFVLVILAAYFKTRVIPIILAASSFALLGLFIGRLNMVVAGQALPLKALRAAELGVYVPSSVEILSVIGAVAFGGFLYATGERFLRLQSAPHSRGPGRP